MAALNQAKIIKALEKMVAAPNKDCIFSFLSAYGIPNATIKRLQMGDPQRNLAKIPGDIALSRQIYFHPVTDGSSLEQAFEDIFALSMIEQQKIRFILVTDYTTVIAYDRTVKDQTTFDYSDFKTNYEFFLPLTGLYEKAIAYSEHPADTKACEKMGRLYDHIQIINQYENHDEKHTLNVFLTRLLFCFFAEDTGIFPEQNQMVKALKSVTQESGSDVAEFFEKLFTVLDLPSDAPERAAFSATFQAFPYVNGGLFKEKTVIPTFDAKARRLLLDCGFLTWSDISPVIFGSMFQSIMDPDKRRSLGAHYTSEKNILKVVRPLFLDELHEEFQKILGLKKGKKKALEEFHAKIASLGFLDPACGCGNFLIVSYRELRELELQVLLAIKAETKGDTRFLALDIRPLIKVSISQFYGIELEEFPVEVARVSMWLMEHVMNLKAGKTFGQVISSIPLQHSATIVCANALTTDWKDVVAPEKLHYIMGNPPFSGARIMTQEQKTDLLAVFKNANGAGDLDFVTAWFQKASYLLHDYAHMQAAFVATNSICQGTQVALLWKDIFERDIKIDFAYTTFKWNNEAKGIAAVFCVIVGFSSILNKREKYIITSTGKKHVDNINAYLVDGYTVSIESRNSSLCDVPNIGIGNQPIDNGMYLFSEDEKYDFLSKEPQAEKYFYKWVGSKELINGYKRYCLWLGDCSENELENMPESQKRIEEVRKFRLSSNRVSTQKLAQRPTRFQVENMPDSQYIAIPKVSSERRAYIPISFFDKNTLVSDLVFILQGDMYHFAILTSAMHMTWMRTVCGRLKSDYRYSRDLCYNTFPWPDASEEQKKAVSELADMVLNIRNMYPDKTLAEMYDPDKMPEPLAEAHHNLDMAVDSLYRNTPFESDEERLQLLFKLYEKLVAAKNAKEKPHA
jgi:hypothetical protein